MQVIETDRLQLRQLELKDADFILKLVNQPAWIKNIGDKNVHTINDAENYLLSGPIKSYQTHGFGFYLAQLKATHQSIGICGLIKRPELEAPDIGFALLSDFCSKGYATEAAQATLDYATRQLKLKRVVATTSMDNVGSMRVLQKIGLRFDSLIDMPGYSGSSRYYVPAQIIKTV